MCISSYFILLGKNKLEFIHCYIRYIIKFLKSSLGEKKKRLSKTNFRKNQA